MDINIYSYLKTSRIKKKGVLDHLFNSTEMKEQAGTNGFPATLSHPHAFHSVVRKSGL
jgi:hypothetical protein